MTPALATAEANMRVGFIGLGTMGGKMAVVVSLDADPMN